MNTAPRLIGKVAAITLLLMSPAGADVPGCMNVQGRLTDSTGAPAAAGTYTFTFRIFDQELGGTKVWPASPGESQTLSVSDGGLWSACAGEISALTEAVFRDASRWLEITVDDGVDPAETLPRLKLNTGPYAYRAASAHQADSISGLSFSDLDDRWINDTGDVMKAPLGWMDGSFPMNYIYESGSANPDRFIAAHSPGLPARGLQYRDAEDEMHFSADGTSRFSISLTTGDIITGEGAYPSTLNSFAGSANSSVVLPNDAVDAAEMLDEPGIASQIASNTVDFTDASAANMIDLVVLTVTTPASGYVVLSGSVYAWVEGPAGANALVMLQIDETAGGTKTVPYYRAAGVYDKTSSSSFHMIPLERIFYKTAGTYTFRLEGEPAGITAGTTVHVVHRNLTATFYPTSYGSVAGTVQAEGLGEFDAYTQLMPGPSGANLEGGTGDEETVYQVDLRELELKAARAEAAAEKARRELLEARSKAKSNPTVSPTDDRPQGDL